MRTKRLPPLAQRQDYQWAASQENRFGNGSPAGGGWGPSSQPVSTGLDLLASRWPEPGLCQRVQFPWLPWLGWGPSASSLIPTKPGALQCLSPILAPRTLSVLCSQASGLAYLLVALTYSVSLQASLPSALSVLAPSLIPTPRPSPITPAITPGLRPMFYHLLCLPTCAPVWPQPHSSLTVASLTGPAHPPPPSSGPAGTKSAPSPPQE